MARPNKGRRKANRRKRNSPPEARFLRTGKPAQGIDMQRAQRLAVRFLSREWRKHALKKGGAAKEILPAFRERIHGMKLPEEDRRQINSQVEFAVEKLCKPGSREKRKKLSARLKRMVSDEALSINEILSQQNRPDALRELFKDSKELLNYLRETGRIYPGFTSRGSRGKTSFSAGWSRLKGYETTPVHETVHLLCGLGFIKSDVPFAQAADRLYGLEKGIFKPSQRFKEPGFAEFDKRPEIDPLTGLLNEPQWAYSLGNRIGQWAYLNLPREKRWEYIRLRCLGESHFDALKKTGN